MTQSSGGSNNHLKDYFFWHSSQYIRDRKRLDDWAEAKICSYYDGGASWSARFWEFLDVFGYLSRTSDGWFLVSYGVPMWYVWDTCSLSHNTHDLYYTSWLHVYCTYALLVYACQYGPWWLSEGFFRHLGLPGKTQSLTARKRPRGSILERLGQPLPPEDLFGAWSWGI